MVSQVQISPAPAQGIASTVKATSAEDVRGSLPLRRLTLAEYQRLIETGFFLPDERVELINGYIVEMSPIRPPHAAAVTILVERFYEQLLGRCSIRSQSPISLAERNSEPEPDIVLARMRADNYANAHPRAADILLVVEVADSSLPYDQTLKKWDYAAEGIAEYWILNLKERVLEAHREPYLSEAGVANYRVRILYTSDQMIAPLAFPESLISLANLFPAAN